MHGFLTRNRHVVVLALIAFALSFGYFALDGNVGINLSDEGYLWYGTKAVRQGQVPIRDFQAYDPGRYVWSAAWSHVFGTGLLGTRQSAVLFQCFGILAGLLAARRLTADWKFLLLVALTLVQWMLPRYKVFDQSITLMAVYAAVLLIERPTVRRHFAVGVFGGLAAFMGRNHGLYHLCTFGILILLVWRGAGVAELARRSGAWLGGIAVGYLPQLALFAFAPGYWKAFLALLDRNVTIGSNVAIPVPWPWERPEAYGGFYAVFWWVQGLFFVAVLVFLAFAAIRILWMKRDDLGRHAVFVAAACVALPYAHHTFSRADWPHLTHSAVPLVLGLVAVLWLAPRAWQRTWWPCVGAGVVLVWTTLTMLPNTGIYSELVAPDSSVAPGRAYIERQVDGEAMHIQGYFGRMLDVADGLTQELAKPEEGVMFLPHWPGLYAATNRRSPVKHLYFTRPIPGLDAATLAQMEAGNVRWVLLQDYALDKRDDLRFKNTNPEIFAYLRQHFAPVAIPELPRDTVLLRRRD